MEIKIDTVDGDRRVATLNGKTYSLLRAYKKGRWDESTTPRLKGGGL